MIISSKLKTYMCVEIVTSLFSVLKILLEVMEKLVSLKHKHTIYLLWILLKMDRTEIFLLTCNGSKNIQK